MNDLTAHSWTWTRATESVVDLTRGTASFVAVHGSDYWRLTASGITVHTGHSLVTPVTGDFDLSARFRATFRSRYDQVGLVVLGSETDWYKSSYELDGDLCVGGVRTRDDSDWSRALVPDLGFLRVVRQGDVVESFSRVDAPDHSWHMIRQFRMEGAADVGVYAAAPLGDGFRVDVSEISLSVLVDD